MNKSALACSCHHFDPVGLLREVCGLPGAILLGPPYSPNRRLCITITIIVPEPAILLVFSLFMTSTAL